MRLRMVVMMAKEYGESGELLRSGESGEEVDDMEESWDENEGGGPG